MATSTCFGWYAGWAGSVSGLDSCGDGTGRWVFKRSAFVRVVKVEKTEVLLKIQETEVFQKIFFSPLTEERRLLYHKIAMGSEESEGGG